MSAQLNQVNESVLVTGGAGYIGSHFINRFLSLRPKAKVVLIDNLSTGNQAAVDYLQQTFPERIQFFQCDVGDPTLGEILSNHPVDAAVHFAASALVAESQKEPLLYYANNVSQTILLLKSLIAHNVRQFVFSSTAAVYGIPVDELITEETAKQPVNVYGETKWMVENILKSLQQQEQLSFVTLRYFNAAGAEAQGNLGESHEKETHLIPLVLHTAAQPNGQASIFGNDYPTPDGTCVRDYIHVEDLATAHIAALDFLAAKPLGTGEAMNLGTGNGNSVLEVIHACETVVGNHIGIEFGPRRPGDPPILVASPDKANRLLGWKAQYNLIDMIKSAWQWEQNGMFNLSPVACPITAS